MRKLNIFYAKGDEFLYGPRIRQHRRGGGLLCVEGKRRCLIGIFFPQREEEDLILSHLCAAAAAAAARGERGRPTRVSAPNLWQECSPPLLTWDADAASNYQRREEELQINWPKNGAGKRKLCPPRNSSRPQRRQQLLV